MRAQAAAAHGGVCDLVDVALSVVGGMNWYETRIDVSKRYWEDLWRPDGGGIMNLDFKY
jgi:hypothetical protein